jgi:exonuclease III
LAIKAKRELEKGLLKDVVTQMLKIDPDVIVCGDFNTERPDIDNLASSIGLKVMAPKNIATAATTQAGHRYDWFLISPDLGSEEAIEAEVVDLAGADLELAKKTSDHLPVRARFRTDENFKDRKP